MKVVNHLNFCLLYKQNLIYGKDRRITEIVPNKGGAK